MDPPTPAERIWADGYFKLMAKDSGKVVGVVTPQNFGYYKGSRVIQLADEQNFYSAWRLGPAYISPQWSGINVLDVESMSLANGARLILWPNWGGGNQKFRLDPVGGGFYRILIEHSGKCLDVEGASMANGARISQWEYWGGDNQKFRLEPAPFQLYSNFYKLVAKHSGRCVEVAGGSPDDGAPIIQWDYWGGSNQHWMF